MRKTHELKLHVYVITFCDLLVVGDGRTSVAKIHRSDRFQGADGALLLMGHGSRGFASWYGQCIAVHLQTTSGSDLVVKG